MATQTAHTATRTADAAGTRRGGGKADPERHGAQTRACVLKEIGLRKEAPVVGDPGRRTRVRS